MIDPGLQTTTEEAQQESTPTKVALLQHLPNDDSSLATFGNTSVASTPDQEVQNNTTSSDQHNPSVISPSLTVPQSVNNTSNLDSKIGTLESNLATLNQTMESKFSQILQSIQSAAKPRGDSSPGDANNPSNTSATSEKTPDPREGEGGGP